ncbi:MAG: glutathione S-transferase family protein [Gammaproteobacteria bacterium]|nr:glutathione S-transferase family protein [Gammaproteobacteria bacterium]
MDKFIFITGNKAYSSWSLRGWLGLRAAGVDFEELMVPLYVPGYKTILLEHSPSGKVPVLKHGKRVIWDSLAICEYLAEMFPKAGLWPEDRSARALARSVSAEMHSGFSAIRSAMPFNCRAKGRRAQGSQALEDEIGRVQQLWLQCHEHHGRQGPWLFGHFTVADCMYVPVALRFVTYGVPLETHAQAYVETVLQHAPVQEWMANAEHEKAVIPSSEVGG